MNKSQIPYNDQKTNNIKFSTLKILIKNFKSCIDVTLFFVGITMLVENAKFS